MMISFPLNSINAVPLSLGSLTGMAPQVARWINDERLNDIQLLLDSHGIPISEYAEATRQLAIGYSLSRDAPIHIDPEAVEWVTDLLAPRPEKHEQEKRSLKVWPTNPFAGIFFAAGVAVLLITAALFATGHPFLGVGCAAGTGLCFYVSLFLNGNFR